MLTAGGVCVPLGLVGAVPWRDLEPRDHLPVHAAPAEVAAALPAAAPPGVELVSSPTYGEVVAAYGGWMRDRALAERLVQPADLDNVGRGFVVARRGGRPVGLDARHPHGSALYRRMGFAQVDTEVQLGPSGALGPEDSQPG